MSPDGAKALHATCQSFKVETSGWPLIEDRLRNKDMAMGSSKRCAEWSTGDWLCALLVSFPRYSETGTTCPGLQMGEKLYPVLPKDPEQAPLSVGIERIIVKD